MVKAELQDERLRVEEWWSHLNKDAATCRRQIDRDERCALNEIDHLESTEAVEEENLAVTVNTQSSVTADGAALDSPQSATATWLVQAVTATAVANAPLLTEVKTAHRRQKEQVDITPDLDAEGGPVTDVPRVEVADSKAAPHIVEDGDRTKATIVNHTNGAESLLVLPTFFTNEERPSMINHGATGITTRAPA